jgi:hypothetical protein
MAWNNNKSGLPKLQGMKKLPEYSDKNLNATIPMPAGPPAMSTDRLASPNSLAAPRAPMLPHVPEQHPELSPRAQKFRRLAGILGTKK